MLYLRKDHSIGSGLGAGASQKYGITRYATSPLEVSHWLLFRTENPNLEALNETAFFGTSATIIPLSISLGSANRVVTTSILVDLNPSISLGSANRAVTMAGLVDLNPSISLGSANRAVSMGVVVDTGGTLISLSIGLGSANRTISTSTLLRVPLPISLGSANRVISMARLIALAQFITYPRNSFITMASNPLLSRSLSVPWTGTVTMGVFVDNGSGSNPQVNASVAKVTGYSLTSVIRVAPTMAIERAASMGMAVIIRIPTSLGLGKSLTVREVEGSRQTLSLGPFRAEDESALDRMTPQELMENRGIPANSIGP